MVVTEVSEEHEVLLVVVALGSPYQSCWLQLLVLLLIVPALVIFIFVRRDRVCCLWPFLDFVNNH